MKPLIWEDGDEIHVALSKKEFREIAEASLKAIADYPDCEFEVRFTEEDGVVKWFVKAKAPRPDPG